MHNQLYILFIPLLPFAGFVLLGLFGKKYFNKSSGVIASLLLLASAVLSLIVAAQYFFYFGKAFDVYYKLVAMDIHWLGFTNNLSINIGILLDPISVIMLIVVTFISLMVHLFSLSYMKGEERFATYYAYLGLFTFSMLGLVMASNLFQMYIFWELVGISSYLLIGFYFQKSSAVAAAKKAFIVTRFADFGFLIGILMLSYFGNSLDFITVIQNLSHPQSPDFAAAAAPLFLGCSGLTWALTLIFMGGAGKSAMFPLHVWLPDAMEGPTPVSALIHAATMVVAGVFLVARLFPLYVFNGASLQIVLIVGLLSSFIAAIIACTQSDIKRILAYSTMSQIGYMMLALAVSGSSGEASLGFTAGMFHLFTHAFFKSLLFLCAGVIIHVVHSNNMEDMGGLRKNLPLTHAAFLIACLAISGIPPFAGFFSKEEILLAAYQKNKLVYLVALITSGLTAFYMFRLYFSVFWNKPSQQLQHHTSTGASMKIPLLILSACTVGAGFISFGKYVSADGRALAQHFDLSFSILPVALALTGILLAMWMYQSASGKAEAVANSMKGIYTLAKNKFYIDELYNFITHRIIFNKLGKNAERMDRKLVDAAVNELAASTVDLSKSIKNLQSGKLQQYLMFFFAGIALLLIMFIYLWK